VGLWVAAAVALSAPAQADLYDGLAALRDTLRQWERQWPSTPDSGDVVALGQCFPGARIVRQGATAQVVWPALGGPELGCQLQADSTGDGWRFRSELGDGRAWLPAEAGVDSTFGPLPAYLSETLTRLRTLSVPGAVRPERWGVAAGARLSATEVAAHRAASAATVSAGADVHSTVPVFLRLAGRDPADFVYPAPAWWPIVRRLAQGCLVYAFLTEVVFTPLPAVADTVAPAVTGRQAQVTWVLLLRPPAAPLLHLLQWQEELELTPVPRVLAQRARLVPGIRQDNVAALFAVAPVRSPVAGRWQVRVSREAASVPTERVPAGPAAPPATPKEPR
jgi:hypothetical protein